MPDFIFRSPAAVAIAALGCTAASAMATNGLIQYPSASPDGRTVVFTAADDLWACDPGSGDVKRLTSHPAREGRSCFSPDGSMIAFESNRDGATNIYVAEISGRGDDVVLSNLRRVTYSAASQMLGSFTNDGDSVLYSAYEDRDAYRQHNMFRAPIDGSPVTQITDAHGRLPVQAADGSVYFIRGYFYPHRSVYEGPGNMDIYALGADGETFERVTTFDRHDFEPRPRPDGSIVYLSARDGAFNLRSLDAGRTDRGGRSGDTLTEFEAEDRATIAHGVRDLAVSGDGEHAYFVVWNTLYGLDLTDRRAKPRAIGIDLDADAARWGVKTIDVSDDVSEAAMHPSGEAIAVVSRGEVFIRNVEEGHPTRRVTSSVWRERDIAWSPDGRWLYYTRDNEDAIGAIYKVGVTLSREDMVPEDPEEVEDEAAEEADSAEAGDGDQAEGDGGDADDSDAEEEVAEEEAEEPEDPEFGKRWAGALRFEEHAVVDGVEHAYAPVPSPNGRSLLYKRDRGDLVLRDLDDGSERVVLGSWSDPDALWAGDSVHLVVSDTDLDFNSDIFILDTRVGEDGSVKNPVNVTRHPDLDHSAQLSADGKVLTFLSDRDSDNWSWDVYAVFLDRDLEGLAEYELMAYFKEAAEAAGKREVLILPEESVESEDPDESMESDKEDAAEPFVFDTDDAYLRVRRLTSTPGSEGALVMAPGGDRIGFNSGGDFVSVDPWGKEQKELHGSNAGDTSSTLDGKSFVFVSSGHARSVNTGGGGAETHSINAEVRVDQRDELAQKFDEAAARFGLNFYHPTLKGLDWDAVTSAYRELAMQTRSNGSFQRVMNFLFGEVDGSHTGIWGGDGFSAPSPKQGHLGIETSVVENGYRVEKVIHKGPVDRLKDGIEVGDVIVAVDDTRFDNGTVGDWRTAMIDTRGREILVEYVRPGDGEVVPMYALLEPVSSGALTVLRYEHEVMERRARVDELSDGRLGYLHIRSMGAASVRDFERDLYAAAHGKDGLIIDVRDNGGGWTTDILLASLTAPPHAYTVPRGADPEDVEPDSYPRDRRLIYSYARPIVVLINENSFSNAEIFAHSIRTSDRGRLIGTQTFGGVISTGSFRLIDGTTVRRPFRGWYLPDGTDMENNGAEPDVDVELTPQDEADGETPQLDAAVKDLLRTVG